MLSHQQLEKRSRRLRRLDAKVNEVLATMRNGTALLLSFHSGGEETWRLSNGVHVSADVARMVTHLPNIVGVGDSLFADVPSQTWRLVNEED
jgi:hypothetical protein